MRRHLAIIVTITIIFAVGFLLGTRVTQVQGKEQPGAGFAAIPGQKGGQDTFGAYEIVNDWPKNISSLPGNEKWTWGAGHSGYVESPNRVFLLCRGEIPKIRRPETRQIPDFAPSLQFPIGRLPWR